MGHPSVRIDHPEDQPEQEGELIVGPWAPLPTPELTPELEPDPAAETRWMPDRLNTRADMSGAWLYGGIVTDPAEIEAIRLRVLGSRR